jgi:hypothetical protein
VLAIGALLVLQAWKERGLAALLAVVLIAQSVLHAATLTPYEKEHLSFLARLGDRDALADLVRPPYLFELARYALRHYPDALLLAGLVLLAMLRDRRWAATALIAGALLAMAFLILLKLPILIHDRYREQVNFALSAWILIALGTVVLREARWRNLALPLLLLAIGYRIARAERIAPYYAERTALIKSEIARARALGWSKAIVPAPVWFGPPHDAIGRSWSTPVESLLLSAKDGPQGTVSLITEEDLDSPDARNSPDGFIFRRWDTLDPAWLNRRWFTPPQGRYRPLP